LFEVSKKNKPAQDIHEIFCSPLHVAQLEKQLKQGPDELADQYPAEQEVQAIALLMGPEQVEQATLH
jgi:hypothetical protein